MLRRRYTSITPRDWIQTICNMSQPSSAMTMRTTLKISLRDSTLLWSKEDQLLKSLTRQRLGRDTLTMLPFRFKTRKTRMNGISSMLKKKKRSLTSLCKQAEQITMTMIKLTIQKASSQYGFISDLTQRNWFSTSMNTTQKIFRMALIQFLWPVTRAEFLTRPLFRMMMTLLMTFPTLMSESTRDSSPTDRGTRLRTRWFSREKIWSCRSNLMKCKK